MVILFLLIFLIPLPIFLGRKLSLSRYQVLLTFFYYCLAGFWIPSVLLMTNVAAQATAISCLMALPLVLLFRKQRKALAMTLFISCLFLFLLLFFFSTPTHAIRTEAAPMAMSESNLELERAGVRHDRQYIPEALKTLHEGQDEASVIASVIYLRRITGLQIGNDPERWDAVFRHTHSISTLGEAGTMRESPNELVRAGFSSIRAIDALGLSGDAGTDFLTFFIRRDLPDQITEDQRQTILRVLETQNKTKRQTASDNFKRGMSYFFLALSESVLLTEGATLKAREIQAHWNQALQLFDSSAEIGKDLSAELKRVLRNADLNHDSRLDESEIRTMIQQRESL